MPQKKAFKITIKNQDFPKGLSLKDAYILYEDQEALALHVLLTTCAYFNVSLLAYAPETWIGPGTESFQLEMTTPGLSIKYSTL